jgi:hypothetical protein
LLVISNDPFVEIAPRVGREPRNKWGILQMRKLMFVLPLLAIVGIAGTAFTQSQNQSGVSGSTSSSHNVTGVWRNENDGGLYYIRQINDRIWWLGEQRPEGGQWANVAYGSVRGNQIELDWADIPKGALRNTGRITLQIESDSRLVRTASTGSFGGAVWAKVR